MTTFGATVRRGGGWLPLIGTLSLLDAVVMLALPSVLGHAVDAIVAGAGPDAGGSGGAAGSVGTASQWLAWAGGLIALGVACDIVDAYASTACVASTTAWLRNRLVRHVLAVGPHGARRFDAGDLVSRVSANAADAAQAGPSLVVVTVAVLPPVGSLVLLALIDLWVAGAFLAGLALVAGVLRAFTRRTARAIGGYQQAQGLIAARLAESLAGVRTIAAAGSRQREERRILAPLGQLREQGLLTWRVLSRSSAQAAIAGPLVLVAVLAGGGLALVDGRISAGDLFAASRYAVVGAGLGGLTGALGRLARARAGARRTGEVFQVAPMTYGSAVLPVPPVTEPAGRLELRGVTVRSDGTTLLDQVDLTLPAGATVAVVGRSGAGKSVLAAIVARLREPDTGQVLLDGVPLAALRRDELRAAVGCAFERPVLVGATVADAVGLGLDADRVRAAAQATDAHEFIIRLPEGYDTPLLAAAMSGGEAQRLGLARAWPAGRLLVLDDATSSLDMVTEMRVGQALRAHRRRSHLAVTHRAATAARADLVVWLEGGRVRAVGPHARLWLDPAYRGVFA